MDFWNRVDKSDSNGGCWLWLGHVTKAGYGSVRFQRSQWGAHRVSYYLHNGEIPDGLVVRHKCHVRHCVNPEHLCVGTQKDNMRDLVESGRAGLCGHKEKSIPWDTIVLVRSLYADGVKPEEISKKLGNAISTGYIYEVVRGRARKYG